MSDSNARAQISAPVAKPAVEQRTDLFDGHLELLRLHATRALGLSVCWAIVEAHSGPTWAEPRDDGSAAVHVALTREQAA